MINYFTPYLELPKLLRNPLKIGFNLPIIDPQSRPYRHMMLHPNEILNDDIIFQIENHVGLKVYYVMLFYKRAGYNGIPHIDCHYYNDKWNYITAGINYNIGNTPSYGTWYDDDGHGIIPDINKSQQFLSAAQGKVSSHLLNFSYHPGSVFFNHLSNVPHKYQCNMEKPTLIRADIPHSIINHDSKDRWAISIRFDTWNQLSWKEYIDRFKIFL